MKSTYKLLTIYLDGKPIPPVAPKVADAEILSDVPDIGKEPSLLDYVDGARTVSGRWMMQQSRAETIIMQLNKLLHYRKLYCLMDYYSASKIANRLFTKRMLQLLFMLQVKNPDRTICLASTTDRLDQYQQIINELYD